MTRPSILVMGFFPAFAPPMSGGEHRLVEFYSGLSQYLDVELVTWTHLGAREEEVRHTDGFREHRIPKGEEFDQAFAALNDLGLKGELSGLATILVSRTRTRYHLKVEELLNGADFVAHDFPYTAYYDPDLESKTVPRLYFSHNFESEMIRSVVSGEQAQFALDLVAACEKRLAASCQLVTATSPSDLMRFHALFGVPKERLFLAPNGYSESQAVDWRPRSGRRTLAVFFGSEHGPNAEAARFIADHLTGACPQIDFIVGGRASTGLSRRENLLPAGILSAAEKDELLQQADLFINPIASGSGTSLKVIEAMSHGTPMLSTTIGARGLDLVPEVHYKSAELSNFAEVLNSTAWNSSSLVQVAKTGREHIRANFSWSVISERVAGRLRDLRTTAGEPKFQDPGIVLVLNDYPVDDPVAGGSRRIRSLLSHAARTVPVVLLCLHDGSEVEVSELEEGLIQIKIPKTTEHRTFERDQAARFWVSVNDIAASMYCLENEALVGMFALLVKRATLLILEHPYMSPLIELASELPPVVYSVHNVEARLKSKLLEGHPDRDSLIPVAEAVEHEAVMRACALVFVSPDEAQEWVGRGRPESIFVIPNGVEIPAPTKRRIMKERPTAGTIRAIFVGSAHPPNVEAARFLIEKLAAESPRLEIHLVGSVCHAFKDRANDSVRLHGVVTDDELERLLEDCDVALNPVVGGGGSSLKLSLYLAHSLAVVTTVEGCRGFSVRDREEVIICDRESFGTAIDNLLRDPELMDTIAAAGRRFAEAHLDWRLLSEKLVSVIGSLSKPPAAKSNLRVLAVTYRYTEPTLGGAEEYLLKILSELADRHGVVIDLVTTSAKEIWNSGLKAGFSTSFGGSVARLAPFARGVQVHPPDAHALGEHWLALQVSDGLLDESLALGRRALDVVEDTSLLGGWHTPESSTGRTVRWSSGVAEVQLAKGSRGFIVEGFSPVRKQLTIEIDGRVALQHVVDGDFEVALAVSPRRRQVLTFRVDAFHTESDPRSLGFLLRQLAVDVGVAGRTELVLLDQSVDALWRSAALDDWISVHVNAARMRDPNVTEAFRALRGPHSGELQRYLESSEPSHDVAIIFGMPFSLAVDAADTLTFQGVPVVMIPHIHIDDYFYHWAHFFDAFEVASAVVVPTDSVARQLSSVSMSKTRAVPGGGIDPEEFGDRYRDVASFAERYSPKEPYFLVLGRKTGSKRYQDVVSAVEVLRASGHAVSLLLIGPDEDGVTVEGSGVHYLGSLPRAVVRGALASCVATISMSESESFGLTLVESWMSGRPVIANRQCQSFRELVSDQVDGLLVSTQEELVGAMAMLLSQPEYCSRMAAAGRRKARNHYTWAQVAGQVLRVLEEAKSSGVQAPIGAEGQAWSL